MEGLEVGMTFDGAAVRAGVSNRTRINWYNRGAEVYEMVQDAGDEGMELDPEDDRYLQFFLAHDKAVADGQFSHWVNLENHAPNDPSISQWILQNRHGITPTQRHEITGRDGGAVQVEDVSQMTADERAARIAAILLQAQNRKANE